MSRVTQLLILEQDLVPQSPSEVLLLPCPPVKCTSFSTHTCSLKDTHCPSWPHTVPCRGRALSQTIKALTLVGGLPKPPRQDCSYAQSSGGPSQRKAAKHWRSPADGT